MLGIPALKAHHSLIFPLKGCVKKSFYSWLLGLVIFLGWEHPAAAQKNTPLQLFFSSKETGEVKISAWGTDIINPWDFPQGKPLYRTPIIHNTPWPDYGTGDLASVSFDVSNSSDIVIFKKIMAQKKHIAKAFIFLKNEKNSPECVINNALIVDAHYDSSLDGQIKAHRQGSVKLVPAIFSVKKPNS